MNEFIKKVSEIRKSLKAPKNQYNAFGKYKYRSCEDIQESIKTFLGELTVNLTDDIVAIGDRFYVKATATITDGTHSISAHGFAREQESKKGMDDAQLTGATSSYARKYALAALLLLDDTRDADSQGNRENNAEQASTFDFSEIEGELDNCNDIESIRSLWKKSAAKLKGDDKKTLKSLCDARIQELGL